MCVTEKCPLNFVSHRLRPTICVPITDSTSESHPDIWFVSRSGQLQGSNGSLDNPFGSLSQAFSAVHGKYNVIYLLEGSHNLTFTHTSQFLYQLKSTLVLPSILTGVEPPPTPEAKFNITIKPLFCDEWRNVTAGCATTRPVLLFYNVAPTAIAIPALVSMEIQNVVFDATTPLIPDCNDPECYYCQYLSTDLLTGVIRDQFGNIVKNGHYAPTILCDKFKVFTVIQLSKGKLMLKNVTFQHFRQNLASLIAVTLDDILVLENVTFSDIILAPVLGSSVIAIDYGLPSLRYPLFLKAKSGFISYVNGVVELLNNGIEVNPSTVLPGFLGVGFMHTVFLQNVTFRYNRMGLVNSSLNLGIQTLGTLLYIQSVIQLVIDHCDFEFNYGTAGAILRVDSDFIYWKDIVNATEYADLVAITHYVIEDCTFRNNSAMHSLLSWSFTSDLQNIDISRCSFVSVLIVQGAVLQIEKSAYPSKREIGGGFFTLLMPSGLRYRIDYPRNAIRIADVNFTKSYYVAGVVIARNVTNIQFLNVNLSCSGDAGSETLFSTTFAEFSERNMLLLSGYTSYPSPACKNGLIFQDCFGASVSHLNVIRLKCSNGPAVLQITDNYGLVQINNSIISQISEFDTSATWILVENSSQVVFSSVEFTRLITENSPISVFASSVSFIDCYFASNNGYFGGVISMLASPSLLLIACRFVRNSATSGGVIYIVPAGTNATRIDIRDSLFEGNTAKGLGGVAEFEGITGCSLYLGVNSTIFTNNKGNAVIHIGNKVEIVTESNIEASVFEKNDGMQSAPLSFEFEIGWLLMKHCQFDNNTGQISSGFQLISIGSQHTPQRSIILSSVSFRNNKDRTVISASFTRLTTFELIFEGNIDTCIQLETCNWTEYGSRFAANNSTESLIKVSKMSQVSLSKSVFENNRAELSGACISIDGQSSVICAGCQFVGNSAGKYGGVAIVRQNSLLNVFDSEFRGNEASIDGASLYFLGSVSESRVDNCTFTENRSSGGLISLLSSSLTVTHSCVRNNTSLLSSPGIVLNLSNLTLDHSNFSAQRGAKGGFVYMYGGSFASIWESLFENGIGYEEGGAIAVFSSTITVAFSVFRDVKSPQGAAIYLYSRANATLINCTFVDISYGKGVVSIYEAAVNIQKCRFSGFNTSAIMAEKGNIQLISSSFDQGISQNGAALWCYSCVTVDIRDSQFRDLNASIGGALWLSEASEGPFLIANSVFSGNLAEDSGAIYVDNLNLSISNSSFLGNAAAQSGGISFICSLDYPCAYSVTSTHFAHNSAKTKGGAISWLGVMPYLDANEFHDNRAMYGNNVASFPTQLLSLSSSGSTTVLRLDHVPSGQRTYISLSFALLDHYGNIVETDSVSTASMTASNSLLAAVKGISSVKAVRGVFTFSNFVVSAAPGSEVSIQIASNSVKPQANSTVVIPVSLRDCVTGEMEMNKECLECPLGMFNLKPSVSCKECPAEALCYGNSTIVPRTGFWRSSNTSDKFFQCFNPDACPEADPDNASTGNNCESGYEGNLCQVCRQGFFYVSSNVCLMCPSRTLNIVRIAIVFLCYVGALAFILRSALKSAQRQASTLSIYLKILMNYFQVVMLISTFDLSWPPTLLDFFRVHQSIGGASQSLLSVNCLFENSVSAGYYDHLLMSAAFPVVGSAILLFFWLSVSVIKCSFLYLRHQLLASIIILFFIVHPSIMKISFSVFRCYEIDGEHYLKEVMSEQCWSGTHLKYTLCVALPCIILWSFGLPAVCLITMVRVRSRLDQPQFKLRFGFLCNGFKPSKFYWEFLILARKVSLVLTSTLVNTYSISCQALTAFLLLFFTAMMQDAHKPFSNEELNKVERASVVVSAGTLFVGLFFLFAKLNETEKFALFIVILLLNAYVIAAFLQAPVKSGLERVMQRFRRRNSIRVPMQSQSSQFSGLSFDDMNHARASVSSMFGHTLEVRDQTEAREARDCI